MARSVVSEPKNPTSRPSSSDGRTSVTIQDREASALVAEVAGLASSSIRRGPASLAPTPSREWAGLGSPCGVCTGVRSRGLERAWKKACDVAIEGWSEAMDLRELGQAGHGRRVAALALRLARRLGLRGEVLHDLRRGALLHDVGKMDLSDAILRKSGPLSTSEWEQLQRHPASAVRRLWPAEILRPALEVAYAHLERWDGSGYPRGLKGPDIPLLARIFAAAEIWDALTHDRPQGGAWSEERAIDHIRGLSGSLLDPAVVKALLQLLEERHGAVGQSTSAADCSQDPAVADDARRAGAPAMRRPDLLIAEDDADLGRSLGRLLERAGYVVELAEDGFQAWERLSRAEVPLLLTDWVMPGLDGLELCRKVRRQEGRPYTYVILVTSRTRSVDRLEALRAGADDFLAKPIDPRELVARVEIGRRILRMQRAILGRTAEAERLAAELRIQNERLAELAWTDGLTGLCNRRRLREALDATISLSRRREMPVSVLMLDVDRFKAYNDDFGHLAGDRVLRELADLLTRNLRQHDVAARYGGEEFLLLLPDTGLQSASLLAERLRSAVEDHPWPHRPVTASIGVATLSAGPSDQPDHLIERADLALYRSKREGRNRVSVEPEAPPSRLANRAYAGLPPVLADAHPPAPDLAPGSRD